MLYSSYAGLEQREILLISVRVRPTLADMAELADAHGSGPCEGYFMKVRILLSAPKTDTVIDIVSYGIFHFICIFSTHIGIP